jgi:ferredoxin-like protein FixX
MSFEGCAQSRVCEHVPARLYVIANRKRLAAQYRACCRTAAIRARGDKDARGQWAP